MKKPYRKNPSPAHTGLRKHERTFLNRRARRRARQETPVEETPTADGSSGSPKMRQCIDLHGWVTSFNAEAGWRIGHGTLKSRWSVPR